MSHFHQLSHTADIALTIVGKSFEELCCESIRALYSVTRPIRISPDREISCTRSGGTQGIDYETIFVALLSDVIFLSGRYREEYRTLSLTITPTWAATWHLYGASVEGFAGIEIKAVTYHNLQIEQTATNWHTTVTLDI